MLCLNRAGVPVSEGCEQGKQSGSPGCHSVQGVTVSRVSHCPQARTSHGSASATGLGEEAHSICDGMNIRGGPEGEAGPSPICPHLILKKWLHKMSEKDRVPDPQRQQGNLRAMGKTPKGACREVKDEPASWNSISVHNPHLCQPQSVAGWPLGQLLLSCPHVELKSTWAWAQTSTAHGSTLKYHSTKKTFLTVPRSPSSMFQCGSSSRGQLKGLALGITLVWSLVPAWRHGLRMGRHQLNKKLCEPVTLYCRHKPLNSLQTQPGWLLSVRTKKTKLHMASWLYFLSRAKISLLDGARM